MENYIFAVVLAALSVLFVWLFIIGVCIIADFLGV